MNERIAKLEQQILNHIEVSDGRSDRNEAQHMMIIDRLESAMLFQNRLRWIGGTFLLIIGSILGWIMHNAHILWDMLPKHGH